MVYKKTASVMLIAYHFKGYSSYDCGPGQTLRLLSLQILIDLNLQSEHRNQSSCLGVLRVRAEFAWKESLHASLDAGINDVELFCQTRSTKGRNNSILSLEGID